MACCAACDAGKTCESLIVNAQKWIQKAIKHPGSFKAYAKENGGLKEDGSIDSSWAKELLTKEGVSDTIKRKARLYFTLKKMN